MAAKPLLKINKDGRPAALKIPKSFGQCADMLHELKEARLAAQKTVDAFAEQEAAIKNHIIDKLPKGDEGAVGTHHKVKVVRDKSPRIGDDEAFYAWVAKNKAFDVLQRSLNAKAIRDRMETQPFANRKTGERKPLPGVEMFDVVRSR
jgi:hypothetical protein